jgi:hypothetical protein
METEKINKNNLLGKISIILMFFVSMIFIVSGATIIVDSSGSGNYTTIADAVVAANSGDIIQVNEGTYFESPQILIDKDLTIQGAGIDDTIIMASGDTGSSGNPRGWFLVDPGFEFNMQDLTLDGDGNEIYQAIRHQGFGVFENVAFNDIQFNPSGPTYSGVAIAAFGTGDVDVLNSKFTDIGRIGVSYFGTSITGSIFSGNTYVGKGDGDWLDYVLDIGAGANVVVNDNTISDNRGVASLDGSTSAGILVTTFYGVGSGAVISENTITGNTVGVAVGYDGTDTSDVIINNNLIYDNTEMGVSTTAPLVDALENYWGSPSGPSGEGSGTGDAVPVDVDFEPWLCEADTSSTWVSVNGVCQNPEDDSSVEFHYNGDNDNLFIQGYAPVGANSASIRWNPHEEWPPKCLLVDQEASPEFGGTSEWKAKFKPQTDGWDNESYTLWVYFFDDNSCLENEVQPRAFGGEFDWLVINDILSTLDDIEVKLNGMNETLQLQIDDLKNIVFDLDTDLDELEVQVTELSDLVDAMNHGTINLRYRAELELLEVWSEAPDGATGVTLEIRSVDDFDTIIYSDSDTIMNDGDNQNRYAFNDWTGDGVDVSSFDPESYDIQVLFTGMSGSYKVSDIFTNLELEDIRSSLIVLYNEDENLWIAVDDNSNNITMLWDDSLEQWVAISDLNSEVEMLWMNNQIQWFAIGMLYVDSFMQWHAIDVLDNKVDLLRDRIISMNHGTINSYYSSVENELEIWG